MCSLIYKPKHVLMMDGNWSNAPNVGMLGNQKDNLNKNNFEHYFIEYGACVEIVNLDCCMSLKC
jgi:hypothetical protein